VIADAAAGNGSFCTGAPVTFTNNSFYAVDFFWDFGDATPIDTNFQPTHIYTTAGSYTVTLIAMDSSSCGIADTFFLPITILPLPVLDLGSDTVFCGAVNLLLDATSANCTYTWSTGALTPTLLVTDTATYWVEIDNGSCRVADTISVSSVSPPDLGNDTTICAGESVVLDAGNPDAQFVWSTGQFIQAITASAQGIYWVDMTQGGCVFRDSMALTVINVPFPALGPDSAICPGSVITLNVSDPAPSYQWSDGSTGMSMAVSTPGTYSVTATIGACVVSDAVNISYVAYLDLGDDALLCGRPDGLVLDAGNAGSQYTWSTGASSQQITVTEPGTYWVSIANAFNCPLSDTINVDGDAAGGLMYLPNCFTPNSDGRNEYFCPESSELTSISMQIFDRWGVLVYQTNTIGDCWDGRYHGSVVPQDVYVVRLRYTTNCTGTHEYMRVEHVTVLR
jgi:gliding motility-associated-like protein